MAKSLGIFQNPAAASQVEAEAGTEPALRLFSPLRNAQAIAALGGGGAGKLVQSVRSVSTSMIDAQTIIPWDDTIPQNTEGTEIITASITPTDTANYLRIFALVPLQTYAAFGSIGFMGLWRDSIANALSGVNYSNHPVAGAMFLPAVLMYEALAPSTSPQTYKIRLGMTAIGTVVNSTLPHPTSRYGGSILQSVLRIDEVAP